MNKALALALLLVACRGGTIVVSGMEVYERIWANTLLQLGQTAAFDMQCPSEQLEYQLLQRRARYPSQVGVTGCGQRVRYVREFTTGIWIANTTNGVGAPAPAPVSAPVTVAVESPTLCELADGEWAGPLRVDGVSIAQSGHAQRLVLTASSLRAHLSGAGWHMYGEADLRRDAILRAQQTMWIGEGVAVPAGGRVVVLGAEQGRVELGAASTPGVEFVAPPRRWLPCAAVGLGGDERNEDTVLDSLSLPRGRAGHISTFTLAHQPGGEPFVRQEEGALALARSVRIVEERHGFTRVAGYLHSGGSQALLVGWTQATVDRVVSGDVLNMTNRDGTGERRCQIPSDLPLFAEGEGLRKQEVGRVQRGTTLWARPSDDGWWNVYPVTSDDALRIADGITLSLRPPTPLQCSLGAE